MFDTEFLTNIIRSSPTCISYFLRLNNTLEHYFVSLMLRGEKQCYSLNRFYGVINGSYEKAND